MTEPSVGPNGLLEANQTWDISALESLPRSWTDVPVADAFRIRIGRFRRPGAKRVVLLVHGASASSRTFLVPAGGLVRHLVERGFDVWTLDWRSSRSFLRFNPPRVRVEVADAVGPLPYWTLFNLDRAAQYDLLGCLKWIGEWLRAEQATAEQAALSPTISLVGHCVGGALVAQAMAAGLLASAPEEFRLGPVVFSTLALFYRVGLEGWVKGNEFLLEELSVALDTFTDHDHPVITPVLEPGQKWPTLLEASFDTWRTTLFAPNGWGGKAPQFVERLAFMYGMPFHMKRLDPSLDEAALRQQFGDMPLGIYMHCVRNLRMGYATKFDGGADAHYVRSDYLVPQGVPVVPMTFITGAQNQVWHRDSIDRTYEWLVNATKPVARGWLTKLVLPDFAHQDLLWSDQSARRVFPEIERGLLKRGSDG